jgi:hypothetical protein
MSSSSLQQKSAAEGTTANNEPPRICIPGQLLHRVSQGEKGGDEGGGVYHAGNGCYEFHGAVYASLAGFVHIFQYKDSVGKFPFQKILNKTRKL